AGAHRGVGHVSRVRDLAHRRGDVSRDDGHSVARGRLARAALPVPRCMSAARSAAFVRSFRAIGLEGEARAVAPVPSNPFFWPTERERFMNRFTRMLWAVALSLAALAWTQPVLAQDNTIDTIKKRGKLVVGFGSF